MKVSKRMWQSLACDKNLFPTTNHVNLLSVNSNVLVVLSEGEGNDERERRSHREKSNEKDRNREDRSKDRREEKRERKVF